MEKKVWKTPEMWDLNVENTEYGGDVFTKVDGDYVEVKGKKYWPSAS